MGKALSEMSKEELWELFPIILKEHNPSYGDWYLVEKEALISALDKNEVKRISHIGSSAVEGLIAKPTIDILLEVDPNCDTEQLKLKLTRNGWTLMSRENEPYFTMSFNKGYTPEGFAGKVFHLHVRFYGDWNELYFRDYLLAHKEAAEEYGKLKLVLKERYEHNRDGYTEAKTEFITKYTKIARAEFGNRYLPEKDQGKSMDKINQRELIIRDYFGSWINKNPVLLNNTFAADAVYSECFGPEYKGLAIIEKWFEDWNRRGTVLLWDIKRFIHEESFTAVEWHFKCEYDGDIGEFDGASVIEFNTDNRIVRLREYQSKIPHYHPYNE